MPERIQATYDATWADMTQLGRIILGPLDEKAEEVHQGRDRADIQAPAAADRRTAASGVIYVRKLKAWAEDQQGRMPAGQMERQEGSQTAKQWYDRCLDHHELGGFNMATPRDAQVMKTAFLNGLKPTLRDKLFSLRPEAGSLDISVMLDMLRAIEDKEEEKKKGKPTMAYIVKNEGEGKKANAKLGPCKKPGHIKRDCRKYQAWLAKQQGGSGSDPSPKTKED